jgi:hypothetical protein
LRLKCCQSLKVEMRTADRKATNGKARIVKAAAAMQGTSGEDSELRSSLQSFLQRRMAHEERKSKLASKSFLLKVDYSTRSVGALRMM